MNQYPQTSRPIFIVCLEMHNVERPNFGEIENPATIFFLIGLNVLPVFTPRNSSSRRYELLTAKVGNPTIGNVNLIQQLYSLANPNCNHLTLNLSQWRDQPDQPVLNAFKYIPVKPIFTTPPNKE